MCYEICPSQKIICKEPGMTAEEAWDIAKKLFADYSNTKLDNIFWKRMVVSETYGINSTGSQIKNRSVGN